MPVRVTLQQQFDQHQNQTWNLRFAPNGQRLVTSDGEALYLYEHNENDTWSYQRPLPVHHATFLCFSPDSQMLAKGEHTKQIQMLTLEGKSIATLPFPETSHQQTRRPVGGIC